MSYRIRVSEVADADLRELYDYIAGRAGFDVADAYVERIIAACEPLRLSPRLGRSRARWQAGSRSIPFERRATIFYTVENRTISIERVAAKGRDLRKMFRRTKA